MAIVFALLSAKLIRVRATSKSAGASVSLMSCIIIYSRESSIDISSINCAAPAL